MKKDLLGYVLLSAAVVGVAGGLRAALAGTLLGWLGLAAGVVFGLLAYRVMSASTPKTRATKASPADGEGG